MMPTIREVSIDDTVALVALWDAVFPEYNDPNRPQRAPHASILRKLAERDQLFWVAEENRALIGSVMAGYDGHRGWIYALGGSRSHRGAGLAAALLKHAEAALRSRGCIKVNLQVSAGNAQALGFYQSQVYADDAVLSLGKRLV